MQFYAWDFFTAFPAVFTAVEMIYTGRLKHALVQLTDYFDLACKQYILPKKDFTCSMPCQISFQWFLFQSTIAAVLSTLAYSRASVVNGQPQFKINAIKNKAFSKFWGIRRFKINDGNTSDCLKQWLETCRYQSF